MNSKEFSHFVLDRIKDGVFFVDKQLRIHFWNTGAETITGYKREEMLDKPCSDDLLSYIDESSRGRSFKRDFLQKTIEDGKERTSLVNMKTKSGIVHTEICIMPILENGTVQGAVVSFSASLEVVDPFLDKYNYENLAYYDQKLMLPNRQSLEAQIGMSLEVWQSKQFPFAFAIIEVDEYEQIEAIIDQDKTLEMMKQMRSVIQRSIRTTDVLGRFDRSSFGLVFKQVEPGVFEKVLERLRIMVHESNICLQSVAEPLTLSIGGTFVRRGDSIASLLERADFALNESRLSGKNKVTIG